MLIRTHYYQNSLPKQFVKFNHQVTEILPKYPHLLRNIRAEDRNSPTQIQL